MVYPAGMFWLWPSGLELQKFTIYTFFTDFINNILYVLKNNLIINILDMVPLLLLIVLVTPPCLPPPQPQLQNQHLLQVE